MSCKLNEIPPSCLYLGWNVSKLVVTKAHPDRLFFVEIKYAGVSVWNVPLTGLFPGQSGRMLIMLRYLTCMWSLCSHMFDRIRDESPLSHGIVGGHFVPDGTFHSRPSTGLRCPRGTFYPSTPTLEGSAPSRNFSRVKRHLARWLLMS